MGDFVTNEEKQILDDITSGCNTYMALCARHHGVLHERRIDRILQRLRKMRLAHFDRASRSWLAVPHAD